MVKLARTALLAAIPVEVLVAVLLLSGAALPRAVVAAAEVAVVAVLVVEAVVAGRLVLLERRRGATRRAAVRAAYGVLVPELPRRIIAFELRGLASIVRWVARRRHGVPPGATVVSYSRAQTPMLMMLLFVLVLEPLAAEIVLRAVGAPAGVRAVLLAAAGYGIVVLLGVVAGGVTRPHVVTADQARIRYGAFLDLRVPRDRIARVRQTSQGESGTILVQGDRLAVSVSAQTNVAIELTEPITVVRPFGRRAQVRTIRFFADDPAVAVAALRASRPACAARP